MQNYSITPLVFCMSVIIIFCTNYVILDDVGMASTFTLGEIVGLSFFMFLVINIEEYLANNDQ